MMASAAPQTTEQAIKQIVADEGLLRLDIGYASYSPSLVQATLWWKDARTDTGQACAFGFGVTFDDAISEAFATKAASAAELAEAA
jgi:hypothetical protein